jgi:ubiquinone/menaquinone biosynthesis C-methylase UbiE
VKSTTEKRTIFETPIQHIELQELPSGHFVLDIGGGGEGLVSRIGKHQVCAIDYRMNEIREAQIYDPPSNWFACDARELCFKDSIFDLATLWFSLGYMPHSSTKRRVLEEVYRVLKSGGVVSLMASRVVCNEDVFVIHIQYELPDGTQSKTGYGVSGDQEQTFESIEPLLIETGFEIEKEQKHEHWFSIEAIKP